MPQDRWLVIGYGNDLRGDDAAGPRAAAAVADWGVPGVRALPLQQLLPELAPLLADAGGVIFIDVSLALELTTFQARPVTPVAAPAALGHFGDPGALLALTQRLFGRAPEAWLLLLPGRRFGFGETLSPQTECAMDAALHWIRSQIGKAPGPFDLTRSPAPAGAAASAHEEMLMPASSAHRLESSG